MSEEIKYLDRRTVARYIARGQISEKDYEKHLKSLPDVEEKATPVTSTLAGEEPAEPTETQ
jgi:hypothetical protein